MNWTFWRKKPEPKPEVAPKSLCILRVHFRNGDSLSWNRSPCTPSDKGWEEFTAWIKKGRTPFFSMKTSGGEETGFYRKDVLRYETRYYYQPKKTP